jgi:elongation factor Ts
MSTISANDVRELRERTGAGMMDCKKALAETNGDMEAAIDWLRKKGLSAAAKKSGRAAAEGLVGVLAKGTKGVLVEVNAETDFVSRNENFQQYVKTVTELAMSKDTDLDTLQTTPYPGSSRNVADELTHLISIIGENMSLRRVAHLGVDKVIVISYLHTATTDMLGRIGVLVALESDGNVDELQTVGKQIAMHVAAANPQACFIEDLSPETVAREEAIYVEQAKASGKPAEFIDKMVEGRVRKFYESVVLIEQVFLIDDTKRTVKQVVEDLGKKLGTPVKLRGFAQFRLGEGVEKKTEDFASEVAAQLKS